MHPQTSADSQGFVEIHARIATMATNEKVIFV
jgi:hypothetical protein